MLPGTRVGGRNSVVGIATRYGLDGSGNRIRMGRDFPTRPDRSWDPTSLLYNGYKVIPGGKGAGAWRSPPTPSRAEVKEKVELLLYSPSGPSRPILGWNLPAWHTCIHLTPQRCIGLLSLETPRRSSLFPSSPQFLQVISPFL